MVGVALPPSRRFRVHSVTRMMTCTSYLILFQLLGRNDGSSQLTKEKLQANLFLVMANSMVILIKIWVSEREN